LCRLLGVALVFVMVHSALGGTTHRARKHRSREQHANRTTPLAAAALAPVDAEADEDRRYEAAKEQAKADPRIQDLKAKSDAASGKEAGREASVAYYQALFQKIREIDKTLTERVMLTEKALMRRLND